MKFNKKIVLSALAATLLTLSGCDDDSSNDKDSDPQEKVDVTYSTPSTTTLSGDITTNTHLTKDKIWILDGLVVVKAGATLKIDAGTTIAGKDGTGNGTSYMIVDKGAKILAKGTKENPIVFTSTKVAVDGEKPAVGQWGGLTIIGHAANDQVKAYEVNSDYSADSSDMEDNSGILKYVHILNSGITKETDKEINGLSLIGVGSGTTIDNITVDLSDDDGIEAWGGTVNMSNLTITRCTDDYFDIDDGYSGTVTNLNIVTTTGNAGIEMSGTTHATFDGFHITQNGSNKEGGIYFKKDTIGGHFKNGTIIDNVDDSYGALHSKSADGTADTVDSDNISFENVTIDGEITGTSKSTLETKYNASTTNKAMAYTTPSGATLSGDITQNTYLTKNKVWILDGLVAVKNSAILKIEAGTTIAGKDGIGDATSYLVVDKNSQIVAKGTEAHPITFTSTKVALDGEAPAVGQWGGLTIIGHAANGQVKAYEVNSDYSADSSNMADNSGILKYVHILNSGITKVTDKEINGLSLVGVGASTVIDNITVDLSDDDGIEAWGGTVNMSNLTITRCTDDYFDIDDGYSGTVTNLNIVTTTGNAAIEMSGTTHATFKDFNITQNGSNKEGGIYFKKDTIGGHFINGTVTDNVDDQYGALHSKSTDGTADTVDSDNISFTNVTLNGTASGDKITGTSATSLTTLFESGTGNNK